MQPYSPAIAVDTETEYRAIEATLLETVRGRWFLAEHGRRARRLDSALLEDAIRRLQASLREPPALLGQLKGEIEAVKAQLAETRAGLIARPTVDESILPTHAILKAAEDIHDIAWSLQANPFDPKGCEQIARNAGRLYAMSQSQAAQSHRAVSAADDARRRRRQNSRPYSRAFCTSSRSMTVRDRLGVREPSPLQPTKKPGIRCPAFLVLALDRPGLPACAHTDRYHIDRRFDRAR